MQDIPLSTFKPGSERVVLEHYVPRSKFPVFDVHIHLGKMCLGPDYAAKYEIKTYMDALDQVNVKYIVNLDGVWGIELDQMLAKIQGFEDRIFTFGWVDTGCIDVLILPPKPGRVSKRVSGKESVGLNYGKTLV